MEITRELELKVEPEDTKIWYIIIWYRDMRERETKYYCTFGRHIVSTCAVWT